MYIITTRFGKVNVAMVPLDSILKHYDNIRVVKIDVEYFEYEVLQGMTETLRTKHPVLFVEVVDNPKVFEYLKTFGYIKNRRFNATPTFEFIPVNK